jgi:Family of unknown function (DUF6951)
MMTKETEVDAGVCRFETRIAATCEDGQNVTFAFQSGCEKVAGLGRAITALGPMDV